MKVSIDLKKYLNSDVLFVILVFYVLYAPPIFGFHSRYFVAFFSWGYLFFNYRFFFHYVDMLRLKKLYIIFTFFALWCFFLVAFNDGHKGEVIQYIYWLGTIIPAALCISIHTRKGGKDLNCILKLVLWAGLIQSFFSIFAFTDFDFKIKLLEVLETDASIDMSYYTRNEIYYRLFGFSHGLTFAMPVTQSMIMGIALYLSINTSNMYLLFVPPIAFSAIINARSSIVVMLVAIVFLFRKEILFQKKKYVNFVLCVCLASIFCIIGGAYLEEMSAMTYGWIMAGVEQIMVFLLENNTKTGYFAYIFSSERWIVPEGVFLLVGTGERIVGGSTFGVYSDIGYINDLWFGGLIYVFVLYILVYIFIVKVLNITKKLENGRFINYFCWCYLFLLPILNFKIYILSLSPFSVLFIVILTHVLLTSKNIVVGQG